MKTVAIIPVHGRLPLLKHTIERLLKKNGVDLVVCIGDSEDEEMVSIKAGAKFFYHQNMPLGRKWNYGFQKAREFSPDVCLFVGSSDWLSDNWLPELLPLMDEYDMVGKPDFTMMDISDSIRCVRWGGYKGERKDEPIGIGRLISARILDKMSWKPFVDEKNNSMDFAMYEKVQNLGGNVGLITDPNLIPLSLSTNKWENKHKFEDHWNNKIPGDNKRINNMSELFELFPEYKQIFE